MNDIQKFSKDADAWLPRITPLLPKGDPERFLRMVVNAVALNPRLLEADKDSLYLAVCNGASTGLSPDPQLSQLYFVTRWNKRKGKTDVHCMVGYRGFAALAYNSDKVRCFAAGLVRKGDIFNYALGTEPTVQHRKDAPHGAEPTHVWASARLDGYSAVEVMRIEEVNEIRDKCSDSMKGDRAQYSPWNTHYEPMALKTVLRRMFKLLPISTEMQRAITIDEQSEVLEHDEIVAQTQSSADILRATIKPQEALVADTDKTGINTSVVIDSANASLPPAVEISNRQHLENLQKQSDARLDAKMEAKREAVAAENAGELKASATETLEEKKKRLDAKKKRKEAEAAIKSGQITEVKQEAPKEYKCIACQDTGHNSKGGDCPICAKKLPSIQEAATVDTVPLSTGESSTLTKLEALYSGTSGLSVDDLRQRGRESWRLLTDEQRATVLRGMLTDDDHFVDDAKKWGPPQWRSFLGECCESVK